VPCHSAVADDGVKLYYEETGSGDPLVFVHEFAGDFRSWEPQVRHFSRYYRCLTYNARGYPPSHVPGDPGLGPVVMLVLILGLVFILGWPLEWVPIVLIVIPILLPAIHSVGIDLVYFCTLVAVCLQTAWLSPPVAMSAYFLKGVVPDWELTDIYVGMMQFMMLQVIGLGLLVLFPEIALWLPTLLFREGAP